MTEPASQSVHPDAASATGTETLLPIAPAERVFGWRNHASLWFVFGVGLLVIQAGTYLTPMVGLREGIVAVIAGSIIGSGILAWTARTACVTGLSSAGLMVQAFGRGFARLPIILNVLQLVGWTTFELVILRGALRTIGVHLGAASWALPLPGALITLVCGVGLALLLLIAPMITLVQHVVGRYDLPLAVAGLAWLSWEFGRRVVAHGAAGPAPTHGAGLLAAMDLVIAMPVSWLPVVADYARHGQLDHHGTAKTLSGTWIGYAIANAWCYVLGVMIATVAPQDGNLAFGVAIVQGGLAALGAMLIHEFSNAYGSGYSASVSGHSVWSRLSVRGWMIVIVVACTLGALFLPMHSMQPFLLLLSSIFVPLFGVILGRLGRAGSPEPLRTSIRIDVTATVTWFVGIALYQGLARLAPAIGSTLPTLAFTFLLGWFTTPHCVKPHVDSVHGVPGARRA